ncbi:MAG TPA: homoserine dehydrogenase [Candidatus Elarobacter sp.]
MHTVPRVLCSSDVPTPAVTARGGIGLLGCGTVGSSVARRLLASHPGLVRGIAVRDPFKPREVAWDDFDGDPFEVVDDPSVRVVVECIGGVGLARELVLRAIARGKDVVTANKDLIATEGPWLAQFAARTGATLRYEAAVGGAIPIVRALAGSLADEDVLEVGGVLNGTTNFILDAMANGADYADALAEAQRLGFAESDPRADVDGHDAAHKLAILAGLAFHRPSVSGGIFRRGIAAVSAADVRAGAQRGWTLKLLALARRSDDGAVEAGVTPAYVPHSHPFAQPRGPQNVVRVVGRGSGALTFSGAGAGGDATASAVVADVIAALEGRDRHVPAHAGEDLVTRPLRARVLLRFDETAVLTPEPVPLDQLEATARVYSVHGTVRAVVPVWDGDDGLVQIEQAV